MNARDQWILMFSGVAAVISCVVAILLLRVKQRVDALFAHGTGIPKGDIGGIEHQLENLRGNFREHRDDLSNGFRGIRAQYATAYDQLDHKLDDVVSNTSEIASEVTASRVEAFADQLAKEIAARDLAKANASSVRPIR